jgi:hypothetical protein
MFASTYPMRLLPWLPTLVWEKVPFALIRWHLMGSVGTGLAHGLVTAFLAGRLHAIPIHPTKPRSCSTGLMGLLVAQVD